MSNSVKTAILKKVFFSSIIKFTIEIWNLFIIIVHLIIFLLSDYRVLTKQYKQYKHIQYCILFAFKNT